MIKNAQILGDQYPKGDYEHEPYPRGDAKLTVRSHILTEILRNAQRWVRGYESPSGKAQAFGSIYDCLLLTPEAFPARYAVVPFDAPKKPTKAQRAAKKPTPPTVEAIAWWDNFLAKNRGQLISNEDYHDAAAAIHRLMGDKMNADLIQSSAKQVAIMAEWHDQGTGLVVPVKCMLDLLPPSDHPVFSNAIFDSKTTMNASPRSFSRDAQKFGYHIQGALYRDLFNAASGERREDFGHVVQENYAPWEFRSPPPLMTQRFLGLGRQLYQKALGIYCRALKTGIWPSYDPKPGPWPMTDCEDWALTADNLYEPFAEAEPEEEQQEEKQETPEEDDIIP